MKNILMIAKILKNRILPAVIALMLVISPNAVEDTKGLVLPVAAANQLETVDSEETLLSVAVVYCQNASSFADTVVSQLENSLSASKTVSLFDVGGNITLDELLKYDVLFPDESVMLSGTEAVKRKLEEYVNLGGALFLKNGFAEYFDKEFLGIEAYKKLEEVPKNLKNAVVGSELEEIGGLILDFESLYSKYEHYEDLKNLDYGYGFVTSTATPVVTQDSLSLYALNRKGEGYVFITNPLLPNMFNINSPKMQKDSSLQYPYAASTTGANTLLYSAFNSFISKEKYGFSLERTFGSYGTTPIAWQLHYEEITGIRNNASIIFSEICKKYNQVPSFTLIRNTYKWFARYETLSYLDIENNICTLDFNEGAYSNGTHVISGDELLFVNEIENTGSYFEDLDTATQRLYPCIYDVNGDGKDDILCGSYDGRFYLYTTISTDGRWVCGEKTPLQDKTGKALSAGSYSAPVLFDFDGDGYTDIFSGSFDGKLYLLKNDKNGSYLSPVEIASTGLSQSMPVLGDVDRDKKLELVVGSTNGVVLSYELENGTLTQKRVLIENKNETFLAPFVFDIDGDGNNDLLCGTYDGYVRRFIGTALGFVQRGYVMANERNYKGNYRVKFGNNAVPRLFDADGDGKTELVCGNYEYGLNVPINSEYFDAKENLEEQIKYIKDNDFYLGVHFYTNEYASASRESKELSLHKEAFDYYGISTSGIGVNQHTWYMNTDEPDNTYKSVKNAGLLWDSGYQSANSENPPQVSTENVLGIPSFMDENNEMFVLNTGTLLYLDDKTCDLSAKYRLPLSVYYHCDFAYSDKTGAENDVKKVNDYVNRNSMSFVREDELVKMAAASYNTNVYVSIDDDKITLTSKPQKTDFALYDEKFQSCVGLRVELPKEKDINQISTDAKIYNIMENGLILTLETNTTIDFGNARKNDAHIASINRPCTVKYSASGATLTFDDTTFCEVYVFGKATTSSKEWDVEEIDGYTVFRSYNSHKLNIVF